MMQPRERAVYSWGDGSRGQLLLSKDLSRHHFFPRLAEKPSLAGLKLAKRIACGREQAVFVSHSGQVKVAGANVDGCLSKDIPDEYLFSPV
jgi:alpha-tubulin suppressor-like RCC1 family protein